VNEEGELKPVVKKRGWKKAHGAIIDYVAEGIASHDPDKKLGNVAVRLAFVHFESSQIGNLRSKVMELVQDEADSDEEKMGKIKIATDKNGQRYKTIDYIESRVTATHSGIEVDGLGALVIPEQS
jgi:hypothetical protein